MPQKNSRILAIDPGTRFMGVALLEKDQLIYHGVEIIGKGKSPNENLQNASIIILRLINDFKPDIIAVEKTTRAKNRNISLLNSLVDRIRAIAKRKKLRLVAVSPTTLKKFTCGNGWAEKKDVATVIVSKFPELRVYLTQDRAWKERFHQNMFDAVALGVMVSQL